jgi:sialate O-acetylesterase
MKGMKMNRRNRSRARRILSGIIVLLFIIVLPVRADVKLPHVIGSGMVVQRQMEIPVWGWAEAGEEVSVEFAGQKVGTTADANGRWIVRLAEVAAGGPHKMKVTGKNTIELTDILAGEVWLCSGQSNMAMLVKDMRDGAVEVAAADYPGIRMLDVPTELSGWAEPDIDANWMKCSPANIVSGRWGGFSAVAYYFGRELHKKLGVPVGLVNASWGGSYIEAWTAPEGFALLPEFTNVLIEIEQVNREYRQALLKYTDTLEAWIKETRRLLSEGKEATPAELYPTLTITRDERLNYRVEAAPPEYPRHPLTITEPKFYPWRPTGLYNSMIHPLKPFAIRGVIWYQGESNLDDGMLYEKKMEALIGGWRKVWGEGDFPFYFVQLAPFRYEDWPSKDIEPNALAKLREAQVASLDIPNTGMAVTTDIGDLNDIHPQNKQDVGKRLALWALAKTYGRDLVYSGPLYESMLVERNKIRINFKYIGGGLVSRDGKELSWFEIAGEDKKFVKAQTRIDGETVLVWSDEVAEPAAVRFGWNQEAQPNLMNKEGLPASPFRTDKW